MHTTELFFKEKAEIVPSPRVHKQFSKAESPALHPHFSRGLNTVWTNTQYLIKCLIKKKNKLLFK